MVNNFRQTKSRPPLESSPGLRFLLYGKHRDGSWGYDEFAQQVVDVMDCHDALYPEHQLRLIILLTMPSSGMTLCMWSI